MLNFYTIQVSFRIFFGTFLPPFWLLLGSILAPFWLHFRSISVPGGPRGGPGDPICKGPVSGSPFHPFWLHFGSILASILESFWGLFSILFPIRFFHEFRCLSGPILAPFWVDFGVVLRLKFDTNSYLNSDAVLGWILGAPGSLRAPKVWFYLRKTEVFKGRPFRPRATLCSILGSKKEARREPKCFPKSIKNKKKQCQQI